MGEVSGGRFWEDVPLGAMTRAQWESLCDGCAKCCLHKIEDEDSGEIALTNVACRLLDRETCRCSNYRHRRALVPDCVRLTPARLATIAWLPDSCAYRLVAAGKPLPDWHHLVSGSPDSIHAAGMSARGWTISEDEAGDIEDHVVAIGG